MAGRIRHPKQLQRKSRDHQVRRVSPNWYKVFSSDTNREYDVVLGVNGGTCSCAWGQHRPINDHRSGCTHVIAAMNYRALQKGRRISVWASERAARRQHRPFMNIGDGLILTSRRS